MKRSIKIECSTINADSEFIIELRQSDISTLILELSMIMMGLLDKLMIIFNNGDSVEISLGEKLSQTDKATVSQKQGRVFFVLSANHLEYLCTFLLRVYRDEIAEVNHLHIEGKKGDEPYDLTLLFNQSSAAMTPEEASRLM